MLCVLLMNYSLVVLKLPKIINFSNTIQKSDILETNKLAYKKIEIVLQNLIRNDTFQDLCFGRF